MYADKVYREGVRRTTTDVIDLDVISSLGATWWTSTAWKNKKGMDHKFANKHCSTTHELLTIADHRLML